MTITLGHTAPRAQLPELSRESLDERGAPRGSAERVAILTLTAAFIFQPILHPSGPANSSPVDLLVVLSIVAAAIWARSGHHKLRAPYFIPVALFVAAGAASGLVGPLPGLALTSLVTDILLFAWCTVVVNVLSNPRAMRYAMAAWSWSGVIWAAVVVCAWLGHITPLEGLTAAEGNRVMFTFGDPNYAATYWTVTIFVVYSTRTPSARWMRWIGYVLLAWALVLTESNGGVLAVGPELRPVFGDVLVVQHGGRTVREVPRGVRGRRHQCDHRRASRLAAVQRSAAVVRPAPAYCPPRAALKVDHTEAAEGERGVHVAPRRPPT